MLGYKRYATRNIWQFLYSDKYKIKRTLRRQFKFKNYTFLNFRYIYPLYYRADVELYPLISYSAYQKQFWWVKYKYINIKYRFFIYYIKKNNEIIRKFRNHLFFRYKARRLGQITSYLYLYNCFFSTIFVDLFLLSRFFKTKRSKMRYYLILSFTKNKLFINFQNFFKRNYLFLSSGLFIKFFEKKKAIKKNKIIKLLMAKYMRKLFLISRIKNIILLIKNNPVFLLEIINFFNTPIIHKFSDPVEQRVIEESEEKLIRFKFLYFIFLDNRNFSNNKQPKKGRIKRKILRKLVFENKLVD